MTATPPRADLRALAASAIDGVLDANGWMQGDPFPVPEDLVDAVLAAVLPEHRRMVLGEATEALDGLIEWQREHYGTPSKTADRVEVIAYGRLFGLEDAQSAIRRLAAAAPPAGLSATVPAENAPAVPEEADGQRAGEGDALNLYEVKVENEGDFRESLRQYDSRHLGARSTRR